MNNQKTFEMLADTEMKLYYARTRNPDNKEIREAHEAVKKALIAFAAATGCHN